MDYRLIHGDCLEVLPTLEAGSVDLVLADPPYGTTACKWDSVIPFEPMWAGIKHVIKRNAAVVLFGSQPFTSALVMSNPKWFKYQWVWNKVMPPDFYAAKYRPLTIHEDVCVFSPAGASYGAKALMLYNPVMTSRATPRQYKDAYRTNRKNPKSDSLKARPVFEGVLTHRFPKSIIEFSNATQGGKLHPTQKPVALLEYLIRTYTNEGETVLDFTMGSGSTGVAALNTGRRFIGIEKDPAYFAIAEGRLAQAAQQVRLAV